jgi:hypothetical protein
MDIPVPTRAAFERNMDRVAPPPKPATDDGRNDSAD